MLFNICSVLFLIGALLIYLGAGQEEGSVMPILAILFWPYIVAGLLFLLVVHIATRKKPGE